MTHDPLPPHLERLGNQLHAAAHERAAPARRTLRTPPRLLAGATLALAVAAVAVTLLVSATASPQAAFAVTVHPDGSVLVKIDNRSGVAGANRRLAALGIRARVRLDRTDASYPQSCQLLHAVPLPAGAVAGNTGGTGDPAPVGNTGGDPGSTDTRTSPEPLTATPIPETPQISAEAAAAAAAARVRVATCTSQNAAGSGAGTTGPGATAASSSEPASSGNS